MAETHPQGWLREFRQRLDRNGVRDALRLLNRLSSHRFTALFRFEGGTLRNLHLIDRSDPSVERTPDQPVLDSYCVYVRRSERTFVTGNSEADERVEGHPKQHSVRSYCGIPLLDERGRLFGTICHFDFAPVAFSDDEVRMLETAAPLIVSAILAGEPQATAA
jgi:GAF domain-containing protein